MANGKTVKSGDCSKLEDTGQLFIVANCKTLAWDLGTVANGETLKSRDCVKLGNANQNWQIG